MKDNTLKGAHIGSIIKKKLTEKSISITEFARKINRERTDVYHLFLILYCCLTAVRCTVDTSFPREEILTQELMPLKGVTCPVNLEVKHPFLMILNWKRTDSLFHIYDLTNHELKHAFGVKGHGPDEFEVPWLLKSQLNDFLIKDKNMLYQFGINEDGIPLLKDIIHPNYIDDISEAAFINDSIFVIDAMYLAPSLYLLSLQDKLPRKTRKYRDSSIRDFYIDPNSGNVYANDSRIAFCYQYKKQIDFLDIELNLIKSVKFKYNFPANTIGSPDAKVSYSVGYLGKRYLYVLFFGKSWKEFRSLYSDSGVYLEVFDLDGNPVIKYRLDGLSPIHFVVDEENFTLYGAREDAAPEDHLLVYQLKGLN